MKHFYTQNTNQPKIWRLTFRQAFVHYAIVLFLLTAPIMSLISLFQIFITQNFSGSRDTEELILGRLPLFVLAILFYFIQKRRLKFKEIEVSVNKEQFIRAAELTAIELRWTIHHASSDSIVATRNGEFSSGSWGELIRIIRTKDIVLINSICDPGRFPSVASYGWNEKNVTTFEEILENCKPQLHQEYEEDLEREDELATHSIY